MGRSPSTPNRPIVPSGERGFTLVEVVVASVIAVIAVLGLAHSFGMGRALVDRFENGRDALALVQQRLERLSALNPSHPDLAIGMHGAGTIVINDAVSGTESWIVAWVDDPVDGVGGGDLTGPNDYKRATVSISWNQFGFTEAIQLSRIFLLPSP
jgi:prepilin-type N-terminal cleavage/methylation domain-containing protein